MLDKLYIIKTFKVQFPPKNITQMEKEGKNDIESMMY